MAGAFSGQIKSFNPAKGWGFIRCAETERVYGKDIFVLSGALPGEASPGDQVTFTVEEGQRGPQAANIRNLSRSGGGGPFDLPAAHRAAVPTRSGRGVGNLPPAPAPAPVRLPPAPPPPAFIGHPGSDAYGGHGGHGGGGGGAYGGHGGHGGGHGGHGGHGSDLVGMVKSYNAEKGWGFVTSGMLLKLYGKDVFFRKRSLPPSGVMPGDQVSFTVVQGQQGPEATGLQLAGIAPTTWAPTHGGGPAGGYGKGGCDMGGGGGGMGGKGMHGLPPPPAAPAFLMPPTHTPSGPSGNQLFFGHVKTFSEEKGWGHVICKQIREAYGKDVFLLKTAVAENVALAQPGALVSFKIVQGNKGPQASEVSFLPAGCFGTDEQPGAAMLGEVKSFRPEKGWGFLTSEDIQQAFGKDIFFHKRELPRDVEPSPGDAFEFSVIIGQSGRLEAQGIVPAAEEGQEGFAYEPVRPSSVGSRASPY